MTSATRLGLAALTVVATVALAACGGGGGGSNYFPIATAPTTPAPTTPPVTPTEPVANADPYDTFLAYVKNLVGSVLDTVDAFDVASFDPPPTSETKDPIPTE